MIFYQNRDRQYEKPCSGYPNKEEKTYKPFVVPQKDTEHYSQAFKSYNIPEFPKNRLHSKKNILTAGRPFQNHGHQATTTLPKRIVCLWGARSRHPSITFFKKRFPYEILLQFYRLINIVRLILSFYFIKI